MMLRLRCARSVRPFYDLESCRSTCSRSYPNSPSYRSGITAITTQIFFSPTNFLKASHLPHPPLTILSKLPLPLFSIFCFLSHPRLSVLFSFQLIINVGRFSIWRDTPLPRVSSGGISHLLCHLCAVYKLPHCSLHISYTASGLKATTHTAGG